MRWVKGRLKSIFRKRPRKQTFNIGHEPALDGFVVELVILLLFRDSYADAVNFEEVAIAVLTIDAFLLEHLADDSAVGRSLVGTQVDTEVKEVFFAFAVFEEILLDLKVGPLERNLHDFSTEMNDGQVDGGIGKQRRMMLGNAFPPFMELGLSGTGSHGDQVVGDGDLDVFSIENHLPEIRRVVMLVSRGLHQMAVDSHEISDAEKAESVA